MWRAGESVDGVTRTHKLIYCSATVNFSSDLFRGGCQEEEQRSSLRATAAEEDCVN